MRRKIPLRCWLRIRYWEYKDREPFGGGCGAGLNCDGHCRNCPAFSVSKHYAWAGKYIVQGIRLVLDDSEEVLEEGDGWVMTDGVARIRDV